MPSEERQLVVGSLLSDENEEKLVSGKLGSYKL